MQCSRGAQIGCLFQVARNRTLDGEARSVTGFPSSLLQVRARYHRQHFIAKVAVAGEKQYGSVPLDRESRDARLVCQDATDNLFRRARRRRFLPCSAN